MKNLSLTRLYYCLSRKPALSFSDRKSTIKKTFTLNGLIFLGISCTLGAGSYSIPGFAAQKAGPAVPLSYIFVGIVSIFAGLPYAEFATMIHSLGYAYSFVQASWGEFIGYITGIFLSFYTIVSISVVAKSWAVSTGYILDFFGIRIPTWFYHWEFIQDYPWCPISVVLILLLTYIANRGAKDSVWFNNIVASINLFTLTFAFIIGFFFIDVSRYKNFFSKGISGILKAQGLAFYGFAGFETITVFGEEAINPNKDIPLSLILSLIIAIILNAGNSFIMVGLAPLSEINNERSLLNAFGYGSNTTCTSIVGIGMIIALISTTFATILVQPRIFYAMSRDGMIPKFFTKMNSRDAPYLAANISAAISAFFAMFVGVEFLSYVISICGLIATALVDTGIIMLRYRKSQSYSNIGLSCFVFIILSGLLGYILTIEAPFYFYLIVSGGIGAIFVYLITIRQVYEERIFECPCVPTIPLIGTLTYMIIAGSSPVSCWLFVLGIVVVGSIPYFLYSIKHSELDTIVMKKEDTNKELDLIKM